MSLLFTNNAVSTLAAGLSIGSTSLTVQAGDGNLFPNPTGNDSFLITLQDASNNIEICLCTSRTGDALTIVRAQEGTGDQEWLAGDSVELRVTAGVLSQYRQGVGDGVISTAINRTLGVADRHQFIECTSGVTITLPDAATVGEGWQVTIKNNDYIAEGTVTIDKTNGSDTIDLRLFSSLSLFFNESIYLSVNSTLDGFTTMFKDQGTAAIINAVYPVGAIYQSLEPDDPATLFGGSWASINGRFLVAEGSALGATYTAGVTGGSPDAVLIQHQHSASDSGHQHSDIGRKKGDSDGSDGPSSTTWDSSHQTGTGFANITVGNVTGATAVSSGNNLNLPPYYPVYTWRRTALVT